MTTDTTALKLIARLETAGMPDRGNELPRSLAGVIFPCVLAAPPRAGVHVDGARDRIANGADTMRSG